MSDDDDNYTGCEYHKKGTLEGFWLCSFSASSTNSDGCVRQMSRPPPTTAAATTTTSLSPANSLTMSFGTRCCSRTTHVIKNNNDRKDKHRKVFGYADLSVGALSFEISNVPRTRWKSLSQLNRMCYTFRTLKNKKTNVIFCRNLVSQPVGVTVIRFCTFIFIIHWLQCVKAFSPARQRRMKDFFYGCEGQHDLHSSHQDLVAAVLNCCQSQLRSSGRKAFSDNAMLR